MAPPATIFIFFGLCVVSEFTKLNYKPSLYQIIGMHRPSGSPLPPPRRPTVAPSPTRCTFHLRFHHQDIKTIIYLCILLLLSRDKNHGAQPTTARRKSLKHFLFVGNFRNSFRHHRHHRLPRPASRPTGGPPGLHANAFQQGPLPAGAPPAGAPPPLPLLPRGGREEQHQLRQQEERGYL